MINKMSEQGKEQSTEKVHRTKRFLLPGKAGNNSKEVTFELELEGLVGMSRRGQRENGISRRGKSMGKGRKSGLFFSPDGFSLSLPDMVLCSPGMHSEEFSTCPKVKFLASLSPPKNGS